MPQFARTASISIVGVTLLLMPEMDSVALLNIRPKSLRLIGSAGDDPAGALGKRAGARRFDQFHMQSHRLGHAVHREIA